MKILALDVGDQWTGTALSDALGILAKPYKTIATHELESFLNALVKTESVNTIIIGYPKTLRGTESDQTKKVIAIKNNLEQLFPLLNFKLWDERLSSKRAEQLKKTISKEEKLKSHSIAAAFILDSYLTYQQMQNKD